MSARAEPSLLSPWAVKNHHHPMTEEIARRLPLLYMHRLELDVPHYDGQGRIVLQAFPSLFKRDPREDEEKDPGSYEWRRSDGMEGFCRFLHVITACCDWNTMEVWDPKAFPPPAKGEPPGRRLSIERIAELADITLSQAERYARRARTAGIISFTQPLREVLPDGSGKFKSWPSLRRLARRFFDTLGLKALIDSIREHAAARKAKRRGGGSDSVAAPIIHEQQRRKHAAPAESTREEESSEPGAAGDAPAAPARGVGPVPMAIIEQVKIEHDGWTFAEVMREALKRHTGPP